MTDEIKNIKLEIFGFYKNGTVYDVMGKDIGAQITQSGVKFEPHESDREYIYLTGEHSKVVDTLVDVFQFDRDDSEIMASEFNMLK